MSIDPSPGGNATAYDYCSADPVNCTDLDGNWGMPKMFKKALKVVAKVAEVASYIPGPIGSAAAAVSAVSYAGAGDYFMAAQMAVTVAAAFVGAGAAVKGISKAVSVASKAGKTGKEFKSTGALGLKAHAKFEKFIAKEGGTSAKKYIGTHGTRNYGKPDGWRGASPLELKPYNTRALKRGESQLKKYERITETRGELWAYHQTRVLKRIKFTRIR